MTTNQKGRIAEAKVLATLVSTGERVLIPFGNSGRYDLALDRPSGLVRIECKLARPYRNRLVFNTSSRGGYGNKPPKDYSTDADFFGVWNPESDKVYLVPVDGAAKSSMTLNDKFLFPLGVIRNALGSDPKVD